MKPVVPKHQRMPVILDHLACSPAAHNALEAYKLLSDVIDQVEDEILGLETYDLKPSRSALHNTGDRMYVTQLPDIFPVMRYTGVMILVAVRHITFISRYGAIEVQCKREDDKRGTVFKFEDRHECVLLRKADAWGDGVWHPKNL